MNLPKTNRIMSVTKNGDYWGFLFFTGPDDDMYVSFEMCPEPASDGFIQAVERQINSHQFTSGSRCDELTYLGDVYGLIDLKHRPKTFPNELT